jgi:twinkle protein
MELVRFSENIDNLVDLYRKGLPGYSLTGWYFLDRHYRVGPSQFTVVTGVPSHGKSEWLDALIVNLLDRPCNDKRWRFLICSPENWPLAMHQAKILEKVGRRRFWGSDGPSRMTEEEVRLLSAQLDERMTFATMGQGETFADLITKVHEVVVSEPEYQWGVVLDPWNTLEHRRPAHLSETEYISEALSYAIWVTRETGMHLWIVAHPTKLQLLRDGSTPVPTLYDISGSAHWTNKCDNGIVIWRNVEDERSSAVEVYIRKVRFRHYGRYGKVTLQYDTSTGTYKDLPQPVD